MPEAQTRLKIAGYTDTGRRRDYNQDHIGFDQGLGIAVLADGMGGHKAGEVAAHMTVKFVLDKLQKLVRLLKTKEFVDQKVLVFTEFADTARYINRQLIAAGISGLAQIDSGVKTNRAETIRRFSPYYNNSSSKSLKAEELEEIRVLISTDVLSEGLNLQDASKMINYDIHWNPVRLMQRIGRVDRRMNPDIEIDLLNDHPELKSTRGTVSFWNFLPPDELNQILTLYTKVTQKTLLISKTLGIEGKKLLTPQDNYAAIREFNQSYEGSKTIVEDMHLEYQALLKADPTLEARLKQFPLSVFSGKKQVGKNAKGVFLCYSLPALDRESEEFTEEAGTTRWYFYDVELKTVTEEPSQIVEKIRSEPATERSCKFERKILIEIRGLVEKHITNSYLKRVDAPVGVRPTLQCWMELNNG